MTRRKRFGALQWRAGCVPPPCLPRQADAPRAGAPAPARKSGPAGTLAGGGLGHPPACAALGPRVREGTVHPSPAGGGIGRDETPLVLVTIGRLPPRRSPSAGWPAVSPGIHSGRPATRPSEMGADTLAISANPASRTGGTGPALPWSAPASRRQHTVRAPLGTRTRTLAQHALKGDRRLAPHPHCPMAASALHMQIDALPPRVREHA